MVGGHRWRGHSFAVIVVIGFVGCHGADAGNDVAWLEAVVTTTVGGSAAEGPLAFGLVSGLDVAADGRIAVADAQASSVTLLSSEGAVLTTIGRRGEGPGEFRLPGGVHFDEQGRLWVRDRGLGRVTVFDSGGVFVRSLPLPSARWMVPWRPLVRGERLFDWELRLDSLPMGVTAYLLRQVNDAGDSVLYRLRHEEDLVPGTRLPRPLAGRPEFTWDREGRLWEARTDDSVLAAHPLPGGQAQDVVLPLEAIPVTEEEAEQIAADWNGSGDVGVVRVSAGDVADSYPSILRLVPTAGGIAVLARDVETATGQALWISDDHGLRRYRLPRTLQVSPVPVIRDAHLYAITLDNLGAAELIVMALEGDHFVRSLRGETSSVVVAMPTAERLRLVGRIYALNQRLEELDASR